MARPFFTPALNHRCRVEDPGGRHHRCQMPPDAIRSASACEQDQAEHHLEVERARQRGQQEATGSTPSPTPKLPGEKDEQRDDPQEQDQVAEPAVGMKQDVDRALPAG